MCENKKDISWDNYRRGIAVYACESDTTHPKVLQLAKQSNLLTDERYEEFLNISKGEKVVLEREELVSILEAFFGFHNGDYEQHECVAVQNTRLGKAVVGEYRYTGEERTDKEWCSTGLASESAIEVMKVGSVVRMEEHTGHGEMVIEDIIKSGRNNY